MPFIFKHVYIAFFTYFKIINNIFFSNLALFDSQKSGNTVEEAFGFLLTLIFNYVHLIHMHSKAATGQAVSWNDTLTDTLTHTFTHSD